MHVWSPHWKAQQWQIWTNWEDHYLAELALFVRPDFKNRNYRKYIWFEVKLSLKLKPKRLVAAFKLCYAELKTPLRLTYKHKKFNFQPLHAVTGSLTCMSIWCLWKVMQFYLKETVKYILKVPVLCYLPPITCAVLYSWDVNCNHLYSYIPGYLDWYSILGVTSAFPRCQKSYQQSSL